MVGNVNGIVESMYAAENARSQQGAASGKNGNFSNYLDAALLNYRTGLFTEGLGGSLSNSFYANALYGSTWQNTVLKALKEELEKKDESRETEEAEEDKKSGTAAYSKKKPDWAKIRVIQRYQAPLYEAKPEKNGIFL